MRVTPVETWNCFNQRLWRHSDETYWRLDIVDMFGNLHHLRYSICEHEWWFLQHLSSLPCSSENVLENDLKKEEFLNIEQQLPKNMFEIEVGVLHEVRAKTLKWLAWKMRASEDLKNMTDGKQCEWV